MKLTPLDIHHKEFRNALRGYSPEQVDDFLDEVADEFERLFKENIEQSEKLEAATARVRAYADMERTLQNTMVAAQTSADDIRARAEDEATRLVAEAETKAQEIVSSALEEKQRSQVEIARLNTAEDEFRARFRLMLEDYLAAVEVAGPTTPAVEPEPVAAPEPVVKPEPELEFAPELELEPASLPGLDVETTGTVTSLTLGEIDTPALDDAELPTLDALDEFMLPPRGPVGERDDDSEIEEID